MANFQVLENPKYTEEIRKFETEDEAHADLFNDFGGKLVNNGAFLKNKLVQHTENNNIHITMEERKKWSEENGEKEITFSDTTSRENLISGEKLKISLGKIKKYFSDLKTVAFSGSYNDLSNKPSIPVAVQVKGDAESAYRVGNVNLTPENIGAAPNHVITNGNFNDIVIPGIYTMIQASTNRPANDIYYYGLIVLKSNSSKRLEQIAFKESSYEIYIRYFDTIWSSWKRINDGGNAATAVKAIQDENGKVIIDTYLQKTGDTANNSITFSSPDESNPASWTNVPVITSGEKHGIIFNKIVNMCKNVRYLYKILGTTSISSIGNGTVTGAISSLNNNLSTWETLTMSEVYSGFRYEGGVMKYHPILKLAFISVTIQATTATTTGVKIDMCKFSKIPSVNTAIAVRTPNTAGQAVNAAIFTTGILALSTDKAIPKDGYILCSGIYACI